MKTQLTTAEQTFISRMADEIVRNPSLSMDDAAKLVLARDEQLWSTAMKKDARGEAIRSALCRHAYHKARQ